MPGGRYNIRVKERNLMASTKTFKFTVSDTGSTRTEFIEAVNPPQAKRMAEARYPGSKLYGFNQVN